MIKKPFDDLLPSSAPHCFHDAVISKSTSYVRLLQTLHPSWVCHLQREKLLSLFSLNVLNPDKDANEDVSMRWEFTHNLSFTGSDATVQGTVSTCKAFLL